MRLNIGFTGISGMLGKNFLDFYTQNENLKESYKIIGISRNVPQKLIEKYKDFKDDIEFRNINYFDNENIKRALESIDILIHAAGITKANHYSIFYDGNVKVSQNLVNLIEKEKLPIKSFIYISTQSVLGPSDLVKNNENIYLDEEREYNPISSYGKSKAEAEKMLRNSRINWVIVRFPTIIGKYEMDSLTLFKFANHGITIDTAWAEFTLSYIMAEDAINLIFILIDKILTNYGLINKNIFHFCYDEPIKIKDFMIQIAKMSSKKKVINFSIPKFVFKLAASIVSFVSNIYPNNIILNKEKVNEFLHTNWLLSNSKTKKILSLDKIEENASLKEIYKWYKDEGLI
ncbi:MAG TPA: NAD(P)-dependent oxidoreductase [Exilispira sp.]|nr:NAD(P)-dependent oxidoreductase [Exilispira sp.]